MLIQTLPYESLAWFCPWIIAIFSVLPVSLARNHSSSPAASLHVERLYGEPVLLSGLPSLVLTSTELKPLIHHHKVTLERLMRLHPKTPRAAVYFLAGRLPIEAVYHSRMLSLLGMIFRLPSDHLLVRRGIEVMNDPPPKNHSWFSFCLHLVHQYSLPHISSLFYSPPTKLSWKKTVRKAVLQYWHPLLCSEVMELSSLLYIRPSHISLSFPHPVWSTDSGSVFSSKTASLQARILSGRYNTDSLRRHWDKSDGHCRLCLDASGDLLHLFCGPCHALGQARDLALKKWKNLIHPYPYLLDFVSSVTRRTPHLFLHFLLDPSTDPETSSIIQIFGKETLKILFDLGRIWLWAHHALRYKILGLEHLL